MDQENTNEHNQEFELFKDHITAGLDDILGFFEPDSFLVLRPADMNIKGDARDIDDLSPQERMAIGEIAFKQLGVDIQTSVIRVYIMEGPPKEDGTPSQTNVTVYRTTSENGMAIHEVTYEDGSILYALGPEDMEF